MLMLEVVSLETSGFNKREVIFSHFIYDVYCEEMFSLSQKKVEKLVLNGFSVFVSGGAGSGKSFFLRSAIDNPVEITNSARVLSKFRVMTFVMLFSCKSRLCY